MAIVWAGPVVETITADNLGSPEVVVPPMNCNRITIQESGGVGSTAYLIRSPFSNSEPIYIGAGGSWVWQGNFKYGEPACYIETVAGTVQFTVVFE